MKLNKGDYVEYKNDEYVRRMIYLGVDKRPVHKRCPHSFLELSKDGQLCILLLTENQFEHCNVIGEKKQLLEDILKLVTTEKIQ